MYPILFSVGKFDFYSFGLCLLLAFLLGSLVIWKLAKKSEMKIEFFRLLDYLFFILIFGLLGARIYYVIFSFDKFQWTWKEIIAIWQGGLGFYGGLLGGLAAALYFLYKDKRNIWQWLDIGAVGIMLGLSIGRIGCFLNGCCYGITTGLPWGVVFTGSYSSAHPLGAHLHPTQLYESLLSFSIFVILILLYKYKINEKFFTGFLFLVGVILYSIGRFLIEFLRGDSLFLGSFKIAQVVSVIIIVTAGYILFRKIQNRLARKNI